MTTRTNTATPRGLRVTRATAAIAALSLGFGTSVVAATQSPAMASCAGPQLSVDDDRLVPGQTVTIRGQYFGTGCNDTVSCTEGPTTTSCRSPGPALGAPDTAIDVTLQTGQGDLALGTVDANAEYQFTVSRIIPVDAALGDATIVAVGAYGLTQPIQVKIVDSVPADTAGPLPTEGNGRPEPSTAGGVTADRSSIGAAVALTAALLAVVVAIVVLRSRRRSR